MKATSKDFVFLTTLLTFFSSVYCDCTFPNHNLQAEELKGYQKLKPLIGKRFKARDPNNEYIYHVGICVDAIAGGEGVASEGVVQSKINDDKYRHVIGRYTSTGIMSGTDWIYLEYTNGDSYGSANHCQKAERKAVILFTCDPHASDSTEMRMLEEQTDVKTGCYYLFEMGRPEVCENAPSGSFLSIGSIILIVFFCVAAVYLVAGALYQRFVLGAKGIEQIPNYEFWKDFGNLQADGCDFVCRSRDARRSSPYKGLGDDQLDEPEERDDNLLPM
ncbi:cation-dependent mannose-6-phosphate receptor-like [Babylonia areolata]|uniref:cation-dependent mannose-6-phosphate receptor-like n=1 Tax=Babylonia areolata TaxID=304850 RepID=UPI003FD2D988